MASISGPGGDAQSPTFIQEHKVATAVVACAAIIAYAAVMNPAMASQACTRGYELLMGAVDLTTQYAAKAAASFTFANLATIFKVTVVVAIVGLVVIAGGSFYLGFQIIQSVIRNDPGTLETMLSVANLFNWNHILDRIMLPAATGQRITLMHVAAGQGHEECLRLLIDHGGSVDHVDSSGEFTPLVSAISLEQTRCANLLLARGARSQINTIIHEGTNLTLLYKILDDAGVAHQNGNASPEMVEQYRQLIETLLARGARVDIHFTGGETAVTPLHLAAILPGPYLPLLINRCVQTEISLDLTDGNGLTPLLYAIRAGQFQHAALLINSGAECNEIRDAFSPVLESLVKAQEAADHNERDAWIDVIQRLINRGVQTQFPVTLQDGSQSTFLHEAAKVPGLSLEGIIANGAHPLSTDDHGELPIHSAMSVNNRAGFNTLLQAMARGLSFDRDPGLTTLHLAVMAEAALGDTRILPFAITHFDGDPNIRLENGLSALHLAAQQGSGTACQALVDCGARAWTIDNREMTPSDYAYANGHVAAALILKTQQEREEHGGSLPIISSGFRQRAIESGRTTPPQAEHLEIDSAEEALAASGVLSPLERSLHELLK